MSLAALVEIDPNRQPVVEIRDGEVFADSRNVATFFRKRHADVIRSIRDLHCSEDFRRRNFASFEINDLTGTSTSHFLMTKNGFSFLVMGFTGIEAGKFKEAYILQFDAMEAELRARPSVPLTRDQIMASALLIANDTMKQQAEQIAVLAPKADALDRIASADGSMCITDAAKHLQMRPKDLFGYLREHRWIYRRVGTDHDVGYQDRTNAGDLEHKVTTVLRGDGSEKVTEQVRVTARGLTKLAKLIPGRLVQIEGGKS